MHLAFVISGTNPLIMQSDLLADPLSEGAKKLKTFSSKKSKTDEDHASIGEIEFTWSMYYDEVIGPYIPAQNVERALRDAAALRKAGKNVERAVSVFPDRIPLQYDGPRDLDALIADRRFHDRRSVVVNGKSRVMRERPRFSNWRLEFEVRIDKNIIKSRQEMESIVEEAGLYIGLGTFRKRFGRFTVESVK